MTSCSFYQIDSKVSSDKIYPAKESPSEVTYLEDLDAITEYYEIIGQVTVNAERRQAFKEVLPKMKREAALLGGDAIANIRTNGGTGKWALQKPQKIFGNANIRENYVADVIVFQ